MNSRYQLLDILQQDEQSRVLLLLDEISGRKAVCRKVHVQADPVLLHQLQQEASLLSVLDHPGFPALLDAFEEDQQLCLIRSWCPGITLQEKLKTRLPAKEKKRIFSQVLCLLEVIHDHGFLYLDLKADNILVDENGKVFLADFNSVLPVGSRQILLSNPQALPPEAKGSAALDERADQYGLGQLYIQLFGKDRIARRLLQHNPEKRYSSLKELRADFSPLVSSRTRYGLLVLMGALLAQSFSGTSAFWKEETPAIQKDVLHLLEEPGLSKDEQKERFYMLLCQRGLEQRLLEEPDLAMSLLQKGLTLQDPGLCTLLLQRIPEQEAFASTRKLTAIACGQQVSLEEMSALLVRLDGQLDGCRQAALLCQSLLLQNLRLTTEQMELLLKIAKSHQPGPEEARSMAAYLLWMQAAGNPVEWPEPLRQALSVEEEGKALLELHDKALSSSENRE